MKTGTGKVKGERESKAEEKVGKEESKNLLQINPHTIVPFVFLTLICERFFYKSESILIIEIFPHYNLKYMYLRHKQ